MIIITARAHDILKTTLENQGNEVLYAPDITYAELEEIIGKANGVVVTTRVAMDRNMIEKAVNLKWIGRLGSGLELIDTEYAAESNILCISSPEGNRNAVAEHTLGMLLGLMNNITVSNNEVKQAKWLREANRGRELSGLTVGIIGFGNTGQAFARLLEPFGVTILAYDKYKENFGNHFVREANTEHICKYADVISFHLPLNAETKYLADEEFFNTLQQKPWILNTSRGEIINTPAIITALENGSIRGAGLDVLENENLSTFTPPQQEQFDFLTNHPAVVLTPHIAGYSHEAFYKMSKVLLEKLGFQIPGRQ